MTFDARDLIYNELELYGATVAPTRVFEDLVGYIEKGEIRPLIAATCPLSELRAAQEEFVKKRFAGKIVIEVTQR